MFASLRRRLRAQSGSEYMMVISVVTVAVVGAAYAFVPQFQQGTTDLATDVADILGTQRVPGASAAAAPGGGGVQQGPGNGEAVPAGDTRHRRSDQSCWFGVICFGSTETATSGGTGGEGSIREAMEVEDGADSQDIEGAWKSYIQEDVAKAAQNASAEMQEKPVCGPAIIAALTGRSIDDVYKELESNGRLDTVRRENTVAGVVTSTEYVTTGVMSETQLAAALRDDYGMTVTEKRGATVADIEAALKAGNKPIVLIDMGPNADGTSGHFGQVVEVSYGQVKIDSSLGSYWMPVKEFAKRSDVMGGPLITVSGGPGQAVASSP